MSNRVVLSVKNLEKIFYEYNMFTRTVKKTYPALKSISFDLHEGEILGILGANGAGKTTLMQILINVMTPSSGSVSYFGKDFFKEYREILQHVSFASTYVQLPGNLTIHENLSIYAQIYGIIGFEREKRIKRFLEQFGMWQFKDKLCKNLSAGQITRVMLAKAFLNYPKIVLLDEPTASLDPDVALEVRNFIIAQQKEHKVSILFTSHNMPEVSAVCDRVLVMKRGVIIADSTPEALATSVAEIRMHLTVPSLEQALPFFQSQNFIYSVDKNVITVELEEQDIPLLIADIGKRGIVFTGISIEKPTLEDYFLHIARSENGGTHS